jgi:hypothetical protein
MSMAEDFYFYGLDDVPSDMSQQDLTDVKYWKTKEGKQMPIFEMTSQHIKNSLAMLKRNGVTELPYEMLRELHQRGDK